MERVPVADELLLSSEGEPGCPERLTVIHSVPVTHRARVHLWSVCHLIHSGLAGSADDPISHERQVGSRSFDDSSCCSGSCCLVWSNKSHRRLVQRNPIQVVSENSLT